MGQGGEGGGMAGGGGGGDVTARAEKLCTQAVSHVFFTLCGKSDAPDKFTGMQVRMFPPKCVAHRPVCMPVLPPRSLATGALY